MGIFSSKPDMAKNTRIGSYESRADYKNNIPAEKKNSKEINCIMDTVKGMDGNCDNLTYEDFANAKTLSIFGDKAKVRIDGSVGLATVELENGHLYSFDFETKEEKNQRVFEELQQKYGSTCDITPSVYGVEIRVKEGKQSPKLINLTGNMKAFVEENPWYYEQEENQIIAHIMKKDGRTMSDGEYSFCGMYRLPANEIFYIPYSILNIQ